MPQNINPRDKQLQGERAGSTMEGDKQRQSSKQQSTGQQQGGQVHPSKRDRVQGDPNRKQQGQQGQGFSKDRGTAQQQGKAQGRQELDPNRERQLIDDDEGQGRYSGEDYKFSK